MATKNKKNKLTVAEEKFAFLVAYKLKSQKDAFIDAFPKYKNWKANSVAVEASRFAKQAKIKNRIFELEQEKQTQDKEQLKIDREKYKNEYQKRLSEARLNRRDIKTEYLWMMANSKRDISENGFKTANTNAFLTALKELTIIDGLSVKEELEIQKLKAEIERELNTENTELNITISRVSE